MKQPKIFKIMSNISKVKTDSDWGTEASVINQNFQNVSADLEKVKSSTTKFKGYFTTEESLKNKFGSPKIGDTAWVGEPYPGIVYDVQTDGRWHNTSKVPDTGSVELQDYATREELTELEEKIEGIGEVDLSGLENKTSSIGYVTCDTAAGTATKIVTVTGLTALSTGIRLLVKMTNNNTASNATLNINSLGAKPLYYNNTRVSGDNAWEAGEIVDIYYDGTNFYSGNFQGGSGEGGNLILEWKTDVATTRKQVKLSDRKSLLQISYKDADGNLVNEQYIGTSFTDTNWANDNLWIPILTKNDLKPYDFKTLNYINTFKETVLQIPLKERMLNQVVLIKEKLKWSWLIIISGDSASTQGNITITFEKEIKNISIEIGDSYQSIIDKFKAITSDYYTIEVIGNFIRIVAKDTEKTGNISVPSVSGINIFSAIISTNNSFIYKIYRYEYSRDVVDDGYYSNISNWKDLTNYDSVHDNISSSIFKVNNIEQGDNIWNIDTIKHNAKIQLEDSKELLYLNFNGVTLYVPYGYAVIYNSNHNVDIVDLSYKGKYYDLFRFGTNSLSPTGLLYDAYLQLINNEVVEYHVSTGYIPYSIDDENNIIINNPSTDSRGKILTYSGTNTDNTSSGITWESFKIPPYSALVHDYIKNETSIRSSSVALFSKFKISKSENILLANWNGRICGGLLEKYLINYDLNYNVIINTYPVGYERKNDITLLAHDFTFIDNELWTFDNYNSGYKILDVNNHYSEIHSGITKFEDGNKGVQMKSVDYKNGILAVGNGSSFSKEGFNFIYLFYEYESWKSIDETITFENCGRYTTINVDDLGIKSYGFWSDCNDMMFVCANLMKDVYLILLGTGENKLEHGDYSYVAENKYNGTYKIIKHWHQDYLTTASEHGGQFYKGNLYVATNEREKSEVYKYILSNDGKLKFESIQLWEYNQEGNLVSHYIDGLAIKDGKIYANPLDGDRHLMITDIPF